MPRGGDRACPTIHMIDKNSQDIHPSESKPGADDFTCSEGQLEDLLANGESTEVDDEERAEKPSVPKSASRERKATGKPAQGSKSKQK